MSGSRAIRSSSRAPRTQILGVCVFAVAMAFVEAMVVRYLRDGVGPAEWRRVLSGQRTLPAAYVHIEQAREAATLVMLAAVSCLACSAWMSRLGCFLLAFGIWDISYYVWLRVLTGFPRSLTSVDILFTIPVHWRAPVWVPTLIAAGFVAVGALLMTGAFGAPGRPPGGRDAGRNDDPDGSGPAV